MNDVTAIFEASLAWENHELSSCYNWISQGLKFNYKNYELYLLLGKYYALFNPDQAYLCYQMALFYCEEEADCIIINEFLKDLILNSNITVRKTAIIILSYNNSQMTKDCIESIRINNDKKAYELIIIDNASTDGILNWLQEQNDILLIKNDFNKGFPAGCNQGIAVSSSDTDILLLNNDTILPPNALFWLRMGLYESNEIGATGSVSNNAVNYQQVEEDYQTFEEWMEYGIRNNVPINNPYETKAWLVGFAMLVKRPALDKVGYLDERFSPGNYEDNDYSMRLLLNGYKLFLCKNSFIYHYGSKSFQKKPEAYNNLLKINEMKLKTKWGINYIPYSIVHAYLTDYINPCTPNFSLLEIGCKLGCTLSRIHYMYPEAFVIGTEHREKINKLSQMVSNVTTVNFEESYGDTDNLRFDYIIIDNSLDLFTSPMRVLKRSKYLLNYNGKIILSFRNEDYLAYRYNPTSEAKGYNLNTIVEMLNEVELKIKDIAYIKGTLNDEDISNLMKNELTCDNLLLYKAETFLMELEQIH